jgi:uncharacterized protein YndB with AHSA1/START domain
MSGFTATYNIIIDAPVHDVFEFCRDPHHLFAGWPALQVAEVTITPDGVGTTAHIVGRFAKGMLVERIEREYTEFVPDERIVSKAHAQMRVAGRTRTVSNGPVFTFLFEAADGGTKLTLVAVEADLAWWQGLLEPVSARVMTKGMQHMLSAIKIGAETRASRDT